MPAWLAIAIPSIVAVAACLMWAIDYAKKSHEIEKLRLELDKLRRDQAKDQREDDKRTAGLYKATPEEIDMYGRRERLDLELDRLRLESSIRARPRYMIVYNLGTLALIVTLLYGAVRLLIDIVLLVRRLL